MDHLSQARQEQRQGLAATVGASVIWGVLPIYWKLLSHVSPWLIILHRLFWSFAFLLLLKGKNGQILSTLALLKNRRTCLWASLRGLVIASNWLIFIWAVGSGHIVEASLGYFMTPMMNAILGMIFFQERPYGLQRLSILLAIAGVGVQLIILGHLPWIAISLSGSFAAYAAMRKADVQDSITGLFLETTLLTPIAGGLLIWLSCHGQGGLVENPLQTVLIMASGVATSTPLLLYAFGTKRLTLTSMGLIQFIAPSLNMIIGVFMYHEEVSRGLLLSFMFIWLALILYSLESLRLHRHTESISTDWRPK